MASNSTRWAEFARDTRLRGDWNLLCPDLRGHGTALTRDRVGMEAWCADLAALLDQHRVERAVVGGHCLGANVALNFAARHPKRVAGLVLVEPLARRALLGTMGLLAPLRALLHLVVAGARLGNRLGFERKALEQIDLEALDQRTRAALAAGDKDAFADHAGPLGELRSTPTVVYFQGLIETTADWPALAGIRVPALALLSAGGTFTDVAITRGLLNAMPDVEIREIDAVHWIPTERPAEMRAAIDDWIAKRFP